MILSPNSAARIRGKWFLIASWKSGSALSSERLVITNIARLTNIGEGPLLITSIKATSGEDQFAIEGLPPTFPGQPLLLKPGEIQSLTVTFSPQRLGLSRAVFEIVSTNSNTPLLHLSVVGTGLSASGNPMDSLDYGNDFVALESPDFPNGPVLRAKTDGSPYLTDNGNPILDCSFGLIENPAALAEKLSSIPGIVEHGLFIGLAERALIGRARNIEEICR